MSKPGNTPYAIAQYVHDRCLCLQTQRAARSLARLFDDALRPAGLTSGQFSLLMGLNRPKPSSIGKIAALLAMDRTTLTANLKPLERRRLVEMTVDPADRRGRLLTLTKAGRALLRSAVPIWKRTHKQVQRPLEAAGIEALRAGLRALS